jgi:methionyl-tRNA synthetase
MARYLVTSALPYANGPLHLGHLAGAYLPADIYVRYLRSRGEDVLYICGTDEHGVPITITAEKMGMSPQQVVDRFHGVIERDFRDFGMSFDNFSRTSLPEHHAFAQEVFLDLLKKGLIVPREMKQLYCGECGRFLPDRYIDGTCPRCGSEDARGDQCESCGTWLEPLELLEPRCSVCGAGPDVRETKHWFLRLDSFQDWLEEWLDGRSGWREGVLSYCRGWLRDGLRERAITRDIGWGVPVPLEEARGKVLYVWFEALLGYVSSTRELFRRRGEPEGWKRYWQDGETRLVHFIGKDNIVFHAVIEPSVLHGLGGYVLPWNVPANEFLNISGRKQSTSRGTAVWMRSYLDSFPADPMRYALAINAPEHRDTDFSWDEFRARNNELADVLGNFANRTLRFAHRRFDGKVPEAEYGVAERELLADAAGAGKEIGGLIERFRLKEACRQAMALARRGNVYFDRAQPWKTAKSDPKACAASVSCCLQLLDSLRVLFAPYLPFAAEKLGGMLGSKELDWERIGEVCLEAGGRLGEPEILFAKLEPGFEDEILERKPDMGDESEDKTENGGEEGNLLNIDDFMAMDLRVGLIEDVEDHPGADRLYLMKVDTGDRVRQIVAGLKPYISRDELLGSRVVVVRNLKPARLRGEVSEGMILASDDGEGGVRLVRAAPGAGPGDRVR